MVERTSIICSSVVNPTVDLLVGDDYVIMYHPFIVIFGMVDSWVYYIEYVP